MADDIVERLREAERSQKTICACCGERKATPLRRSEMGGYVCLTCIDTRMDEIESLRARVAVLEGALVRDLNVTDDELLRIRNDCEHISGTEIRIWATMLQKIVDSVRAARRALTPVAETPNQEPAP